MRLTLMDTLGTNDIKSELSDSTLGSIHGGSWRRRGRDGQADPKDMNQNIYSFISLGIF